MDRFYVQRASLAVALVLMAGCGGSQSVSPSAIRSVAKVAGGTGGSGDLLYVSTRGNKPSVQVFDYPSGKPVETLKDPAFGLCSNASGDVFAVDYIGTINWYSHDGTKIGELGNDPGYPQACAVDPMTGNLAVAGAYKNVATANVEVFPWQGSSFGSPTTYTDPSVSSLIWCAYDNDGNLFANASVGSNGVALDELPGGGSSLSAFRSTTRCPALARSNGMVNISQWQTIPLAPTKDQRRYISCKSRVLRRPLRTQ